MAKQQRLVDPFAEQRRPPPAAGIAGSPVIDTLPAGSRLWRIHHTGAAGDDYPSQAHGIAGRFDTAQDGVSQLYLADSFEACVAEALLRDTPLVDRGARQLPFAMVGGRSVSELETQESLALVRLHGSALAAVGQGLWLTKSGPQDYPLTRAWADALRAAAPEADGFMWRCRFDEDRFGFVTYEDRGKPALSTVRTIPLDAGVGLLALRAALLNYNAVIGG